MITYAPSPHFKQRLRDFDDHLLIKWVEATETIEIWSTLPNKRPVMEHKFCRNNKARKNILRNWDMEWIVLSQLARGRRLWQHSTANEFANSLQKEREQVKAKGEEEADTEFGDFLKDPYWLKKKEQEENDDFGSCKTAWSGTSTTPQKGNKNDNANMESKSL